MPRQDSKRGTPITGSAFEAPFETHIFRYGQKGLNITDAIDALEPNELQRMLNVTWPPWVAVKPKSQAGRPLAS